MVLSSSEARRRWREVLATVVAGGSVTITLYGHAVAVLRPVKR